MSNENQALYLFCFARLDLEIRREIKGLYGHGSPRVLQFAAASAVVSTVPVAEFVTPDKQDLAWVAPRVCWHEQVIEEVMQDSPVLPARFGTLFSSSASLQEFADRHGGEVRSFFQETAGQEEWGVKGWLDIEEAQRSALTVKDPEQEQRLASLPPGVRYLEKQKLRSHTTRNLRTIAETLCQPIADELRGYATNFYQRQLMPSSQDREGSQCLLNWAFLVPREAAPAFRARVAQANSQHQHEGLHLEVTGPWPPYSFTPSLDEDETR